MAIEEGPGSSLHRDLDRAIDEARELVEVSRQAIVQAQQARDRAALIRASLNRDPAREDETTR
jgi:hypothetical protein